MAKDKLKSVPPKKSENFLNPPQVLEAIHIKEGMRVADFGCGSGHISFAAAKLVGKDGLVYALDIQKSALEAVKSKARLRGVRNIETKWTNLEIVGTSNLDEDSIDIVILANILHQSKLHKNIFKEAMRVLKPGGHVFILDWKTSGIPLGKAFITRVEKDDIKKETIDAGFKFLRDVPTDDYHYGMLFTK